MSQRARRPRSVLFALGDEAVAAAFARILDGRSHSCTVATSSLEVLESEPTDTFIADLSSAPQGSFSLGGLELLADLQSIGLSPFSILIAGPRTTQTELERAEALGVHAVLESPVRPEALVQAVEAHRAMQAPAEPQELTYRDVSSKPVGMTMSLAAEHGAAEAAARDLVGWCARCEVVPSTRARIATAVAEVIQNGIEHGAHQIHVDAAMDRRQLTVTVDDDGPGFDTVHALTAGVLSGSTGLGRIHALAETVSMQSAPDKGTRVILEFSVTTADFED
ncbi:MAG: ATP-binding protein, partial [Planctomycetota bacterium]